MQQKVGAKAGPDGRKEAKEVEDGIKDGKREEKEKEVQEKGKEDCTNSTCGEDPTMAATGVEIGVIGQDSGRWVYSRRRCPRQWSAALFLALMMSSSLVRQS